MYVLDTNTVVYFFKGLGNVARRLLDVPPAEVALPAVVLYELEVGVVKSGSSQRRQQLEEMAGVLTILPFGRREAAAAAELRAALEVRGTPIGPHDTLIAGTTLVYGGILVTHNTREFSRVPQLRLEDWY